MSLLGRQRWRDADEAVTTRFFRRRKSATSKGSAFEFSSSDLPDGLEWFETGDKSLSLS